MLDMGNAVGELTHDLCQRGPEIRKLQAEHPSWTWDMTKLFGWLSSQKRRLDTFGFMTDQARPFPMPTAMVEGSYALWQNDCKQMAPLMVHQSNPVEKKGKCCWDDCPGKRASTAKHPHSSNTYMCCEECSILLGNDQHQRRGAKLSLALECLLSSQ